MNTRTRLSIASVTLLVGAVTGACGGASGAPTDASEKDYCKAQNSQFDDIKIDVSNPETAVPSGKDMAEAMRAWGKRMEKVGTPKNISDDARAGFETMIKQASDVSEDDFKSPDLSGLEKDLSKDDKKQALAYSQYAVDTCGSMLGEPDMSDMPDAPDMSEMPSPDATESTDGER